MTELVHGHSQAFGGDDYTLCGLLAKGVRSTFLAFQDGRVDGDVAVITCALCKSRASWEWVTRDRDGHDVQAEVLRRRALSRGTSAPAEQAIAAIGPYPLAPTRENPERRIIGAAQGLATWEAFGPLVATLPDGSTVALPAGTVLREEHDALLEKVQREERWARMKAVLLCGCEGTCKGHRWDDGHSDPLTDVLASLKTHPDPAVVAMTSKLVAQVERGSIPLLSQARALLQRARPWIAPGVPDIVNAATEAQPATTIGQLRAEIDAFLAGLPVTSQDVHSVHGALERLRLDVIGAVGSDERMAESGLPAKWAAFEALLWANVDTNVPLIVDTGVLRWVEPEATIRPASPAQIAAYPKVREAEEAIDDGRLNDAERLLKDLTDVFGEHFEEVVRLRALIRFEKIHIDTDEFFDDVCGLIEW